MSSLRQSSTAIGGECPHCLLDLGRGGGRAPLVGNAAAWRCVFLLSSFVMPGSAHPALPGGGKADATSRRTVPMKGNLNAKDTKYSKVDTFPLVSLVSI